MNRRDFLKLASLLSASMSLGSIALPQLAEALEELSLGTTPVLWLQLQACSGCSVSLLNTDEPGPAELLTRYINLLYHSTLSTATGELAMEICRTSIRKGGFILVAEGAVPVGMPEACVMGHAPMGPLLLEAARQAKAIVTVGTCASWGGIPAAEGNPTGAVSAFDYIRDQGVKEPPMIRLPGCPVHPDWVVGTLAHVVGFGLPKLDKLGRPTMFFDRTIHDQCPRFADFEREKFAKTFGDPGCFFELGCAGPRAYADCTQRLWNSRTNFCIKAGAPCIGCVMPDFARSKNFPMFPKGMDIMARRQELLQGAEGQPPKAGDGRS
ncbi:MAG: hydrogenase small subunit [Magnetococcales bacterium]|nr:hydrogenase small subunit [Magnetococcales bacterium]